jgi:hypothetical protein
MSYSEERNYTIGETVYRAKWDKVEAGIVRSKRRVSISNSGGSYEDPDGKYVEFVAQFNDYDWVGQTYAWKFFRHPRDAYRRLAYEIKERIDEYERKIAEWRKYLEAAEEKAVRSAE